MSTLSFLQAFRDRCGEDGAADFGTVAGEHTADELRDLLRAKDHDVGALNALGTKYLPTWQAQDAAEANDWTCDMNDLQGRYQLARSKAEQALALASRGLTNPVGELAPAALIATESAWQSVIKALKQAGDPGPETKGDLSDLSRRLSDAGADFSSFGPTPQPNASDEDLSTLNKLATVDVAAVATGESSNPTATKLLWGIGIAAGAVVLVQLVRVFK